MKRRSISEANNPNYDSGADRGYASINNAGRNKPRGGQASWPYIEPVRFDVDDEEELESEEEVETQVAIANKTGRGYVPGDSYARRSIDHRKMVGPDFRMWEQTTGRSISPIPDLYKNKQGVLGTGADGPSIRPAPARISLGGSTAGWSRSYPLRDLGSAENAYTLADIPTSDEMTMSRLRRLIRAIHDEQELEKDKTTI